MTANEDTVSLGDNLSVLELDSGESHTYNTVSVLKITGFPTLKP